MKVSEDVQKILDERKASPYGLVSEGVCEILNQWNTETAAKIEAAVTRRVSEHCWRIADNESERLAKVALDFGTGSLAGDRSLAKAAAVARVQAAIRSAYPLAEEEK